MLFKGTLSLWDQDIMPCEDKLRNKVSKRRYSQDTLSQEDRNEIRSSLAEMLVLWEPVPQWNGPLGNGVVRR